MKKFSRGTVVAGCEGAVTGETDDDVLAPAAAHAKSADGDG